MTWLDTLLDRGREPKGPGPADPLPVLQLPAKPRAQPAIKAVPVQTGAPFGSNPGAITVGYYSVQDDVVVMHDGTGIPTGKRQHLGAGEGPRGVAYRLTRESWRAKTPDFNRPIHYGPSGVA